MIERGCTNRKRRCSINIQLVSDPDLLITNRAVKWPGSDPEDSALYVQEAPGQNQLYPTGGSRQVRQKNKKKVF